MISQVINLHLLCVIVLCHDPIVDFCSALHVYTLASQYRALATHLFETHEVLWCSFSGARYQYTNPCKTYADFLKKHRLLFNYESSSPTVQICYQNKRVRLVVRNQP